jgi:hypothetical protein
MKEKTVPLPNRPVFDDVRTPANPTPKKPENTLKPVQTKKEKAVKPSPSKVRTPKLAKQKAGKVSCTFHLPKEVRDELQALSFMTATAQNIIVEKAVREAIASSGIKLPKRAA